MSFTNVDLLRLSASDIRFSFILCANYNLQPKPMGNEAQQIFICDSATSGAPRTIVPTIPNSRAEKTPGNAKYCLKLSLMRMR